MLVSKKKAFKIIITLEFHYKLTATKIETLVSF